MADLDRSPQRCKHQFSFVLYDQIARDFDEVLTRCRPRKKTNLIAACLRHALAEITDRPDPKAQADIQRLKEMYQAPSPPPAAEAADLAALEQNLRTEMRRQLEATVDASLRKTLAEFIERTPVEQFHRMKKKLGGDQPDPA